MSPKIVKRKNLTPEELEAELRDLGQIAVETLGSMLREDSQTYEPETRLKAVSLALEYSISKPARKLGVTDKADSFGQWIVAATADHDADPGDA